VPRGQRDGSLRRYSRFSRPVYMQQVSLNVTLWNGFREALRSNPDRDTNYPERDLSWFSTPLLGTRRDITSIKLRPLSSSVLFKQMGIPYLTTNPTLQGLDTENRH
jgi:hypothetical protein